MERFGDEVPIGATADRITKGAIVIGFDTVSIEPILNAWFPAWVAPPDKLVFFDMTTNHQLSMTSFPARATVVLPKGCLNDPNKPVSGPKPFHLVLYDPGIPGLTPVLCYTETLGKSENLSRLVLCFSSYGESYVSTRSQVIFASAGGETQSVYSPEIWIDGNLLGSSV